MCNALLKVSPCTFGFQGAPARRTTRSGFFTPQASNPFFLKSFDPRNETLSTIASFFSTAQIRWNRDFFFSFLPPYKLIGATGMLCTGRSKLKCVFFFVWFPYTLLGATGVFFIGGRKHSISWTRDKERRWPLLRSGQAQTGGDE